MKLSAVFISMIKDDYSLKLLQNAVSSFKNLTQANNEIIIIESGNINIAEQYFSDDCIIVHYDQEKFNFHHALNLGLKKATGHRILFSNNDVLFQLNWYDNLDKVMSHFDFQAASPVDPKDNKLWMYQSISNEHVEGYEIQKHFKGWCFVVNRDVFQKIKKFDEKFEFYWADNDFILELLRNNFRHAVVTTSYVHHLEKTQIKIVEDLDSLEQNNPELFQKVPKFTLKEKHYWKLQNSNMIKGLISYHEKWGEPRLLNKKIKLATYLIRRNFGFLNRWVLLK